MPHHSSNIKQEKSALFVIYIDKNKPNCSRRELLGPDKIHPNSEGGQIVADNFDLRIFG